MTKFLEINESRPGKIVSMLSSIEKSARSQKASPSEVGELLAPVVKKIEEMSPPKSTTNPGGAHTHMPTQSHWNSVIEMARTAPIKDALAAMSIIANRAEEEL